MAPQRRPRCTQVEHGLRPRKPGWRGSRPGSVTAVPMQAREKGANERSQETGFRMQETEVRRRRVRGRTTLPYGRAAEPLRISQRFVHGGECPSVVHFRSLPGHGSPGRFALPLADRSRIPASTFHFRSLRPPRLRVSPSDPPGSATPATALRS